MKNLVRAGAGLLCLAAVGITPTPTSAYTIFDPTQYYLVRSDGWSMSCVYDMGDWQVWNTDWQWGDFWYGYYEAYTHQWSRHWLFDFESNRWTYTLTVNYANFN